LADGLVIFLIVPYQKKCFSLHILRVVLDCIFQNIEALKRHKIPLAKI
jgi:hypothetical protein